MSAPRLLHDVRGVVSSADTGSATQRGGALADELRSTVNRLMESLISAGATATCWCRHIPTGETVEVDADRQMNALSTIKVPILVVAFRDASTGTLNLDDRHSLEPGDFRRGSGVLQRFSSGLAPTLRDLCFQMIATSDNTATDLMLAAVGGPSRVNAVMGELGLPRTKVHKPTGQFFRRLWERVDPAWARRSDAEVFAAGLPSSEQLSLEKRFAFEGDPTEWLSVTTARELGTLLHMISESAPALGCNRDQCNEMVEMMKAQMYNYRISRRMTGAAGGGVVAAHKTGDFAPFAANDVALLDHAGGRSVVSIFVNQNRGDYYRVEETMADVGDAVVAAWSGGMEQPRWGIRPSAPTTSRM